MHFSEKLYKELDHLRPSQLWWLVIPCALIITVLLIVFDDSLAVSNNDLFGMFLHRNGGGVYLLGSTLLFSLLGLGVGQLHLSIQLDKVLPHYQSCLEKSTFNITEATEIIHKKIIPKIYLYFDLSAIIFFPGLIILLNFYTSEQTGLLAMMQESKLKGFSLALSLGAFQTAKALSILLSTGRLRKFMRQGTSA